MVDTPQPVELVLIRGRCLFCDLEGALGTPDNPPLPGSPVVCGGCCALHVLEATLTLDGWVPVLMKPGSHQRLELMGRDDVRAVRDAYQLDQLEHRMARVSEKPPKHHGNVTGRKVKVRSGDQVHLRLEGPS